MSENGERKWRAVVWLDRDGTLVDDPGYLDDPAQLRLLPNTARAVARLNAAGVCVVLITNQSGIARGLMSRETVEHIHTALREILARDGAHLDGIYFCPHLPAEEMKQGEEPCACRKPKKGLVVRATQELGLGGLPSVVVGDKASDLELARRIGSRSVLVRTGEGRSTEGSLERSKVTADHVSDELAEAADWIVGTLGQAR